MKIIFVLIQKNFDGSAFSNFIETEVGLSNIQALNVITSHEMSGENFSKLSEILPGTRILKDSNLSLSPKYTSQIPTLVSMGVSDSRKIGTQGFWPSVLLFISEAPSDREIKPSFDHVAELLRYSLDARFPKQRPRSLLAEEKKGMMTQILGSVREWENEEHSHALNGKTKIPFSSEKLNAYTKGQVLVQN